VAPQVAVTVIESVPHDRATFTEGLAFWNGRLFESSGNYRQSYLREVELATGKALREVKLEDRYFGEGLAILGGKIYQLTWREQTCFVYDLATLRKIREIRYDGEGWGLATDGKALIMSDGSEWIRFRDPATFAVTRSIRVMYQGRPLTNLNELEVIDGRIWANVWGTDLIFRLDPADGRVVDILDAAAVFPAAQRPNDPDAVLNGIAYDEKTKRIYITGKRWPHMYRVRAP
jgi:glutamine cyclotransferase